MSTQHDYSIAGEGLYRRFAARHGLALESDPPPDGIGLVARVQPGLSFELMLLAWHDTLQIEFEGFVGEYFPYERVASRVEGVLDALMIGECRLAVHRRRGTIVKRILEQRIDGAWKRVYGHYQAWRLPFLPTTVTYIRNQDAPVRD